MVRIKRLVLKGNYRIQWLKYVRGVDLGEHCIKCLLGKREKKIVPNGNEYTDLELEDSPYYYFCAVYNGWNYDKNVHLAFRRQDGSIIHVRTELFEADVEDAERIDIDSSSIDPDNPHAGERLYIRCRNWQFANWLWKNDPTIEVVNAYRNLNLYETKYRGI